ncbi:MULTISPECIES: ABC transporter substrate-binding protein [unclassified Streptomyces]|uniref:ABC transporter substrate-binding protein n=1 Tax=unclassified Streptomyces TaxID=2593676 RepID=UPI002E2C0B76|nr:ABC transporter substrate-binding protein [Streptomyces sp. NBC_00223]
MKNSPAWLAAAVALGLSAAACAPGGGVGSSGANGPIRIAYLGILSGPNAVKGSTDAFELAIKQINAEGGINGRTVEYKKFDTDITPQGAARATSLALRYRPVALVGYSVTSGLKASILSIKGAGIPVLHNTLGSLTSAKNLKYDRAFRMGPTTTQYAEAANSYLIDTLGVKSFLMLHTEDAAPSEGARKVIDNARSKGIRTTERAVPPNVTDLTEPVLAARKADAIWEWGYATTDALVVKQAAQNNVKVPVMTFSVGSAVASGLLPAELATKNTLNVSNCGAAVLRTPESEKFVAAYTKAYGRSPADYLSPNNYDSMYLIKAAIEQAGSTDGAKVSDALRTITRDGACGTLKADDKNNMFQNVPVLSWEGGKPTLAKLEEKLPTDF